MADTNLLLSRAKAAMLSRDYDFAARTYRQLLAEHPTDVSLLQELGAVYIKSGDDAHALPEYERIIAVQSDNVNALITMGGIYRRQERYDESVAVLEKARTIDSRNMQIAYNLGFTYKMMGEFDKAISCFEDVIDQNPADVLTYNHVGAIYAERGEFDKAIASYQRGLKIDANHPILLLNIAKSYVATGELDKALANYESALRSKPGWREAVEEYSELLLRTDHVREAYDVLHDALQLNPTNARMHSQLGDVFTRQSSFSDAKQEYKAALKFEEDYDPALLGLANAHESLDEHDEAVRTIQRVEERHPDDVEIKRQAAHILLSANEYAAAFERISELREQNPADVQSLSLLGQYYICNGDWDKVEECYNQIAAYDPTYIDHYKDGAKRFRQKGDAVRAEKYLRIAIDTNPKDAGALVSLASLLEEQSHDDAALSLYKQASDIDRVNMRSKNGVRRLQQSQSASPADTAPVAAAVLSSALSAQTADANLTIAAAPTGSRDPFDQEWFDVDADGKLIMDSRTELTPPPPQNVPSAEDSAEHASICDDDTAAVSDAARTDDDTDFAAFDALTFEETSSEDNTSDGAEPAAAATDDTTGRLEETLQVVNDSARKAEQAAAQAWEAALVAADSAQALTAALNDSTARAAPDASLPEVDDEFAAYDALTVDEASAEDSAEPASICDDDTAAVSAAARADDDTDFAAFDALTFEETSSEDNTSDGAGPAAVATDDTTGRLEETLQVVNDSARKAEQAAAQAWEAALVAADSAQALTAALNDSTARAAPDAPLPEVDDEFAAYDALTVDESVSADSGDTDSVDSAAFADNGVQDAVAALDNENVDDGTGDAVAAFDSCTADEVPAEDSVDADESIAVSDSTESADAAVVSGAAVEFAELQRQLSLFERLRSLCEFLPAERYDSFMSSRPRLLMDYIISRLSGKAGLLQRAAQQRQEAGVTEAPDIDEKGIELVTHVVDDMLSLIEAVPDEQLRAAMNDATQVLIEKLIAQ